MGSNFLDHSGWAVALVPYSVPVLWLCREHTDHQLKMKAVLRNVGRCKPLSSFLWERDQGKTAARYISMVGAESELRLIVGESEVSRGASVLAQLTLELTPPCVGCAPPAPAGPTP